MGLEPTTSTLRVRLSTHCATSPLFYSIYEEALKSASLPWADLLAWLISVFKDNHNKYFRQFHHIRDYLPFGNHPQRRGVLHLSYVGPRVSCSVVWRNNPGTSSLSPVWNNIHTMCYCLTVIKVNKNCNATLNNTCIWKGYGLLDVCL